MNVRLLLSTPFSVWIELLGLGKLDEKGKSLGIKKVDCLAFCVQMFCPIVLWVGVGLQKWKNADDRGGFDNSHSEDTEIHKPYSAAVSNNISWNILKKWEGRFCIALCEKFNWLVWETVFRSGWWVGCSVSWMGRSWLALVNSWWLDE